MKRISTLFAFVLFTAFAGAQTINETFENYSSISNLTNNCRNFSGVGLSTTTGITSTKSLVIIPTTSAGGSGNSNIAQIITPYINLQAGTSLTYQLKLSNDLAGQATRTVQVRLLNIAGIYSGVLATITLNKNSSSASTYTYTVNVPIVAAGIQRLVLDITGNGDGNSWMFIDNLVYSSTYNYSALYACGSYATPVIFPIKLLSFQGTLVNNKAQLKWLVDENNRGNRFEVEKSSDGKAYSVTSVVFTTGKQRTEAYIYNETKTTEGGAYYRIKIINKDNSNSYTKVIFLKNTVANTSEEISLVQNPIQSALAFSFNASESAPAKVNLYNMAGVNVYSFNIAIQKGANTIVEPVDNRIAKGTYILEVSSTTQRRPVKVTKYNI